MVTVMPAIASGAWVNWGVGLGAGAASWARAWVMLCRWASGSAKRLLTVCAPPWVIAAVKAARVAASRVVRRCRKT